jgi:hypothetical protein
VAWSKRPSPSELFAWGLVGAGLGAVAGFVMGQWLGEVDSGRLSRAATRLQQNGFTRASRPKSTINVARAALRNDDLLRSLELELVAVSAGVIELHGWVPSRSLRARAVRILRQVPEIEILINCLLVRGEDDAE